MTRVLRALWVMIVFGCVGTVIAEAVLLASLAKAWRLDRPKIMRMLAVAQTPEPSTGKREGENPLEPATEQASYEELLERRALGIRNIELREMALAKAAEQVAADRDKLAVDQTRFQEIKDGFQKQLVAMQQDATAAGKEEARRVLEALKPKQAKEQLVQMLDRNEMDQVVALLTPMPDNKRSKIFSEFKAPGEAEKLSEILRRIRDSLPSATTLESTKKQVTP